jgi:hypothetical protein
MLKIKTHLQLSDRLFLLLQRLQIDLLLHLHLLIASTALIIHKIIFKCSRIVRMVRTGTVRSTTTARWLLQLTLVGVGARLSHRILFQIDCFALDRLEGRQRRCEFVNQTISLDFQVTIFTVDQLFKQIVGIFDQLLCVGSDLISKGDGQRVIEGFIFPGKRRVLTAAVSTRANLGPYQIG